MLRSSASTAKWVVIVIVAAVIIAAIALASYGGAKKCLSCGRVFSGSVTEFMGTGYCYDCAQRSANMSGRTIAATNGQYIGIDLDD